MESIGRNNMIIEKYFKLFFKNSLKEYNFNTTEGIVLLLLMEKEARPQNDAIEKFHMLIDGQSQDQMIDEVHYDKAVMTRTMQSLETKGYVIRNVNPIDSRSYIFSLTKKAIDFKPILLNILKAWNDGLQNGIDKEKLEIVNQALSKMAANAIELTKGE
jgi:Transcriptional regulators